MSASTSPASPSVQWWTAASRGTIAATPSPAASWARRAWPLAGMPTGTTLVVAAYLLARRSGASPFRYHLLWLGFACAVIPVAVRLAQQRTGRTERQALLLVVGLFALVPKLMRNSGQPVFFDEYAHLQATERFAATGHPGSPNLIAAIADYPGLHAVTNAIADNTGLSLFHAGLLVVCTAHLALLFAVAIIASLLTDDDRLAGLTGLFYAVSPGFAFFTVQFAYESLALALLAWALVCALWLLDLPRSSAAGTAVLVGGGVFAAATAVTHHVTSFILVGLLAAIAALAVRERRQVAKQTGLAPQDVDRQTIRLAVLLLVALIAASFLAGYNASALYHYLSPFPKSGATELKSIITRSSTGSTSRSAFSGSALPKYEQLISLLAVPLVLALAVWGWLVARRRTSWCHGATGFLTLSLALLYPISLPFVFTSVGQAGAHRSWPFTMVFVLPLVATGVLSLRLRVASVAGRWVALSVIPVAVMLVAIGSMASEAGDDLRFPGPYVQGSDARVSSPELTALASWLRTAAGPRQFVLSDITTDGPLIVGADADTDVQFPTWDLDFYDTFPNPVTLDRLRPLHVVYLVIDLRMAAPVFRGSFFFDSDEPQAFTRTEGVPLAALLKFNIYDWSRTVYTSTHYQVYRLDLDALPRIVS